MKDWVIQYTFMENLFGTHILIGTCDTKTVIGELTVHREDGHYATRMPWGKYYDTGKRKVLFQPRKG